jgi:hypothetical protein
MRKWSGKRNNDKENMQSKFRTLKRFALNSLVLKSYEINCEPIKTKKGNGIRRFWSKVDKNGSNDCWPWQAAMDKHGVGQSWFENKNQGANRVAWKLTFGEIPKDYIVKTNCGLRNCVNPQHLILVIRQFNHERNPPWDGMMLSLKRNQNTKEFIGMTTSGK